MAIASVTPEIRRPDDEPTRRGGHLVLVFGADDRGLTFHNPSGLAAPDSFDGTETAAGAVRRLPGSTGTSPAGGCCSPASEGRVNSRGGIAGGSQDAAGTRNRGASVRVVTVPMTAAMEFGLLGPVLVRRDGAELPVAAGKQRAVLAALLLAARPGRARRRAGRGAVGRGAAGVGAGQRAELRGAAAARAGRRPARIQTRPGGYRIQVEAGELDVARFEDPARQARAAAREGCGTPRPGWRGRRWRSGGASRWPMPGRSGC